MPKDSQLKIIEACFRYVRELQAVAGDVPIVGNEYSWFRQYWPYAGAANLAAHACGLVGQGRSSLAYPDAARDIFATGKLDPKKCCVSCSKCTQIMRDHGSTGCVMRDHNMYMPLYKAGRKIAQAQEAGSASALEAAQQQSDAAMQAALSMAHDEVCAQIAS